jgi:8-oxo-dGTP diphosphatase
MAAKKISPEVLRKQKGVSFVGITTCFFVHDGKGHFYMTKRGKKARDEQGKWEIGGGGLKWGETALDNALREAMEEYNVTSKKTEFLGYRDIFRELPDGTKTHWLGLDFAILADPKDVRINEPETIDDGGWFSLDDLPSPMHSQQIPFMKQYKKKLAKILKI